MHTKGPWKYIGKGTMSDLGSSIKHPCVQGYIRAGNGQSIINSHAFGCPHGATPEEADANARLIAAAPELMEALEGLLVGRPTEEPPNEMSVAHRNWLLFEKGREAIHKAKGD